MGEKVLWRVWAENPPLVASTTIDLAHDDREAAMLECAKGLISMVLAAQQYG